jgi:hypothetical protein
VELAPQLVEPVLDRRTGERDAPVGLEPVRSARDLTVGVLDRLALVEDDRVPGLGGEHLGVVAQDRIARQHDIGGRIDRAARAVIGRDREIGTELLRLGEPVEQDARRRHDQRALTGVDRGEHLDGLAKTHVVGEHAAKAGLAAEGEPVDAAVLVRPQLALEALEVLDDRDAGEALEERLQLVELGWRWLVEIGAQLRQIGERVDRNLVIVGASGEQIGDALAVLIEPRHRHATPATAGERDDIDAGLPRAQRGDDRGLLAAATDELDVELRAVDRDPGLELDGLRGICTARVGAQPSGQAGLHRERLAAGDLDAPTGDEVQLVAQAVHQLALGILVANRQRTVQVHDAATVDARARRIAVHERREHVQAVAVLLDVEDHPRILAAANLGQRTRADRDLDALGERRDRLADELGERRARDVEPLRQLLELRAGEIDRADRTQHVVGRADDADRDDLAHQRIGLDRHPHATARILDQRARQDRLGARGDRLAEPADVARVGEHAQQAIQSLAGDRAGPRGDQRIGQDVGLDARDAAGLALGDERHQRAGQGFGVVAADQHPLHRDAAGGRGQQIADRRGGGGRLGELVAGLFGRQDRGDDVRADRLLARAAALPLAVRRVQDHVERGRSARNPDLERDLVAGPAVADHPLVAGQRDALRPDPIGRLGPDRVAERLEHPPLVTPQAAFMQPLRAPCYRVVAWRVPRPATMPSSMPGWSPRWPEVIAMPWRRCTSATPVCC